MSEFFGPPPPPPTPPPPHRVPVWSGPPDNELGVAIPVRLQLARNDDLVLAILGLVAFSTGFSFTFAVRRRVAMHGDPDAFPPFHPGSQPDVLRVGIEFADGAKATTLDRHPHLPRPVDNAPSGPLLLRRGGGGGGRNWNHEMWVWPLPPPGALAFVCDWRAENIPLSRREIEAEQILDAAAQAEQLWPDGGGAGGASATTTFVDE